jgi:DNA-binding GntR family transcriptional regulator
MREPSASARPTLGTPIEEVPHLREQVYERLRRAIINGEMGPGERLTVSTIAQRLGVSTMPVREAIRLLEDEGLVETSARRWTRVATVSIEEAEEFYPLIGVLEEFAVVTGKPATRERLKRLRQANAALQRAASAEDVLGCIKADEQFHSALLESCTNGTLLRTIAEFKARMGLLEGAFYRDSADRSTQQHRDIIAALEQGDLALAGARVRGNWESGLEVARGHAQGSAESSA